LGGFSLCMALRTGWSDAVAGGALAGGALAGGFWVGRVRWPAALAASSRCSGASPGQSMLWVRAGAVWVASRLGAVWSVGWAAGSLCMALRLAAWVWRYAARASRRARLAAAA